MLNFTKDLGLYLLDKLVIFSRKEDYLQGGVQWFN